MKAGVHRSFARGRRVTGQQPSRSIQEQEGPQGQVAVIANAGPLDTA